MNEMPHWSTQFENTGNAPGTEKQPVDRNTPSLLLQGLAIARRRLRTIIATIAAAVIAGLVVTLLMTPRYTAEATLEIQRDTGSFVHIQGAEAKEVFRDEEFYETQYGLLRAQSLAERVATELGLYNDKAFLIQTKALAASKIRADDPLKAPRQDRIHAAGAALLRSFAVNPGRFSRLVEISYSDSDPLRAKRVIDKWSESFIRMALERRFEASRYARNFLETRLSQLRSKIDDSQRQLVAYAARANIINVPIGGPANGSRESATSGERSIVADNLSALNQELNAASADRIRAEARLHLRSSQVTEALENPALAAMRQRRAETAAEYAKMRVQFEPGYPPMEALQRQIAQLDSAIASEEGRIGGTLRQTYQAAKEREKALRTKVKGLEAEMLDYRRRSVNYEILQREVDTNQQLYDALLQRYKEIGVAGGVGINNVSVIDGAEVPNTPSSPRLMLNLLVAIFAGILFSVGIVLALEQIDQGVNDPSEVEDALGIPILGAVSKVAGGQQPVEQLEDRKSLLSEAYRSIQTSLGFATDHGLPRTLGITSSRPAEGKSTTSYAIARSFSSSAGRILLIDADMRSPSIHHVLGLSNKQGLSNYLSGDEDFNSLIQATPVANLSFIAAGPTPPSASELLATNRFSTLLTQLREQYDHIVVDLPPVMGLADAPLAASMLEGVIFVLEAHATKRGIAQVAVKRLISAHARIFGAVFSKFDSKQTYLGSGYGAAYGYHYGYGYGDTAPRGKR